MSGCHRSQLAVLEQTAYCLTASTAHTETGRCWSPSTVWVKAGRLCKCRWKANAVLRETPRFSRRMYDAPSTMFCSSYRVREEANWLFKCISEAHNVLSDSRLRRQLDAALELEERYMFYRNDLTTPPGGVYSFQRPAKPKAPANPRYAQQLMANPRYAQ